MVDSDDEPYGIPIGLPLEMMPDVPRYISPEEQQRRLGEAIFFGMKSKRLFKPDQR